MKGFFAALLLLLVAAAGLSAEEKSKVYFAMDGTALGAGRSAQSGVIQRMVDTLVISVTGKRTVADAWKSLVKPTDKVGIKISTAGRGVSGTNPEVVWSIVDGLRSAGVPKENIIVWDRNLDDMLAAGYKKTGNDYQLRWVDPATGYDSQSVVSAPILGRLIWGDSKFGDKSGFRFADLLSTGDQLSSRSYYCKVLTKEVTKVINVPSLTDSFLTGINGAIVNMTLANLDNWRRFAKSASEGDSYMAEIYSDPMIKDKVVLTILDGLVLQYAGGPFPNPNFAVDNFTLFASRDPVAIDATAARLVEEYRKSTKMPSVLPMTSYIQTAEAMKLGAFREDDIEMIRVRVGGTR